MPGFRETALLYASSALLLPAHFFVGIAFVIPGLMDVAGERCCLAEGVEGVLVFLVAREQALVDPQAKDVRLDADRLVEGRNGLLVVLHLYEGESLVAKRFVLDLCQARDVRRRFVRDYLHYLVKGFYGLREFSQSAKESTPCFSTPGGNRGAF